MKKPLLAVMLAVSILLSGCGGLIRETGNAGPETTDIDIVKKMEEVEDGGFYILRNDSYERLYAYDANYDRTDKEKQGDTDSQKTLWYREDWSKVPTMYKGDKLIYKTSQNLDETFSLERFEYVGYTVGISNLKRTASGRYSFTKSAEENNINQKSDAKQLETIPTETGIIDKIGGAFLRDGNISSGGCIIGLEKDKMYKAEVYAGTFLQEFNLTADTIALTSMEYYETVDYSFMQSQLLEIHFPEHFNSGYYLVDGYGLVRYVNGTSYDKDTDFNIPNKEPEEGEGNVANTSTGVDSGETNSGNIEQTEDPEHNGIYEKITIANNGTYNIVVEYEDKGSDITVPAGVFYNNDRAYHLNETGRGVLSNTVELKAGEYTLMLTGMNDRKYTYEVKPVEGKTDSPSTQEETQTESAADTQNTGEGA